MKSFPCAAIAFRSVGQLLLAVFLFAGSAQISLAVPAVNATLDDGTPAATRKLVGETITYTTTISNTAPVGAGNDATGVIYTVPTPTNTTDTGSVIVSPVALDDTYPQTVIGNVSINSANIPYSVFTNDFQGQNGGALTITAFDATSAQGGQVTMTTSGANMGQFTYNPPRGFEGADTFTYTLSNSLGSSVGTVTLNVSGMVWFINSAAGGGGDGRLSAPYNTTAAFQAVNNGSGNNPASGDNIFLYSGSYTSGLTLLTNQRLIGAGATQSLATITGLTPPSGSAAFPATGGARPTVGVSSGTGVTLGSGNNVQGLNVTNSNGNGITGSAVGTLTLADFDVTVTGGSALSLTTSGTVTATGSDNDLNSTNGPALNVVNVNIGAAGLTFKSISSGAGTNNGISLDSTGTSGGLTVSGAGSAGSGGTISNKSGADGSTTSGIGIYLNNTRNIALNWMTINGTNQNFGIRGTNVTNFTMNDSSVVGTNGTTAATFREGSVIFDNLLGSGGMARVTISGAIEDTFRADNSSGTLTAFNVTASSFLNNSTVSGNIGFRMGGTSTANMTASLDGSTFQGNRTDSINVDAGDSSTVNMTITNNTIIAGTGGNNQGNLGIDVTSALNGVMTYAINGNKVGTPDGTTNAALINTGINVFGGNTSTIVGTVKNNRVILAGAGMSGIGIRLVQATNSTFRSNVDGNTISNVGLDYGIQFDGGQNTGAAGVGHLAVTNNTASVLSAAIDAIRVRVRNGSVLTARIEGNVTTAPSPAVGLSVSQGNTARFNLEDDADSSPPELAIGPRLASEINTYVVGKNPGANTTEAFATVDPGNPGTGQGFFGVVFGSVNVPPLMLAASPAEPAALPSANTKGERSQPPRAPMPRVASHSKASVEILSQSELDALVTAAAARWEATGLSDEQRAVLRRMKFEVADLPGTYLGEAGADCIRVDRDAGGNGWNLGDKIASDRVDLFTTILHEMGHALGLEDTYATADRGDLMYGFLHKGERRLPAKGQALGARPGLHSGPHFLAAPVNIGTLPAGKSVKIQYAVTVGPISGNPQNVTSQGTVSGGNFVNVLTDDPTVGGASDPTVTLLGIAPAFTSANSTTFTVGSAGNFNMSANGAPPPTFSTSGLPSGVMLSSAGVLSGTPAAGTGGVYNLTITASNGINPAAMQSFTLTVNEAPAFTSANSTTFVVGTNGSFQLTASGHPTSFTFTNTGSPLPSGVTLSAGGLLGGTPAPGTGGVYNLTFQVSNGVGSPAMQSFTLTVNEAPSISSANSTTFVEGNFGSFNVTASGYPAPTFSATGTLPSAVTFAPSGLLSGPPAAGTMGAYPLQITATNGIGSDDVEGFTLNVNAAVCANAPANLVAWFPGEGNATEVQNGRNGTAQIGVTFAAGKVGQAINFNGGTSQVTVPDDAVWDFGATDFTIQTWVKINTATSEDVFIGHSDGSGSVNKWIFWRKNGSLAFHLQGSAVANITSTVAFTPTAGQWYHVAVVRSGNTYRFYVDGAQNGGDVFDSNTVPDSNAPLTLGRAENLTGLIGGLDEVQIYSRALSGAEIAGVYNASFEGVCYDALQSQSAVSRKNHGVAGDFDVALPLTGTPGVECRSGGVNGDHTIRLTFNNVVTAGSASVSAGSISGSPTFNGRVMTINLTGVSNAQSITVTVTNATDGFGQTLASVVVPMDVLLGDVTASRQVNAADVAQVKANSGAPVVDITNFRSDLNTDGAISASDVSMVKTASGTVIP